MPLADPTGRLSPSIPGRPYGTRGLWPILVLAVFPAAAPGEQRLADYRRVVLDERANPVQQWAADELVNYVGRLTGQRLAQVRWPEYAADAPGLSFFVGGDVAARVLGRSPEPWAEEEWLLRTVPGGLVLAGHDGPGRAVVEQTPAGTLLATYTLLDDYLGVRWFWPGPFGEHVPDGRDAALPELDLRRTPAFAIRSVSHGTAAFQTRAFNEAARLWARRSRLGWVRSAAFGHSWDSAFEQQKGLTFREHPEWFALVGGRRRPPQMCTTNPDVIDRMVRHALGGKTAIVSISPSDGGGFCECERCRRLDVPGVLSYDKKHVQLSDRLFTYANEVARRVREEDPNKGVGMFAYTYYNRPPVRIKRLEPNLYLSFVYQCAAHRDPENLREWRQSVGGWQQLGAKLVAREGWGNHYYHDLPFLHYDQIIANLAEAHRLGFVGVYGDGSKNFATMAPNNWALTRMLWDPRRDPAQVMPEFYRSAYGPAAAPMAKFFETYSRTLDEHWKERNRHVDTTAIAYANIICAWRRLLPESAIAAADRHLREAERLAPPGAYADRVRFHRFGQEYTAVTLELLETYRRLGELGVQLDWFSTLARERRDDPAERGRLLRRADELGERREQLYLSHRDWAGPDEGGYASAQEKGIRQWHAKVKECLGIERPSVFTRKKLTGR